MQARSYALTRRSVVFGLLPALVRGEGLERQVGVTTSSFTGHLALKPKPGQIALLDLPRFMRAELDMRVIDLNTRTLAGATTQDLEKLRGNAVKEGCVLTNLKLNYPDLLLDSPETAVRDQALATYKQAIDQAALLGCRWTRVLPQLRRPDWERYVASMRKLTEYAQSRSIQMVVENYGWMESDPSTAANLIRDIGLHTAAQPDIGNWSANAVRYDGLSKLFPLAVSCDFKAMELGPAGEHKAYDLHRCFEIGWKAGFRGPWCIEHLNNDYAAEMRGLKAVRDLLRGWMAA